MIWDRVPSAAHFRNSYESFLLGLDGALSLAVEVLKNRQPRLSITKGQVAIGQVLASSLNSLGNAARMAIAEAVTAGRVDAGAPFATDPSLQIERAERIKTIIEYTTGMDALNVRTLIRNQALAYDIAYRTLNHQAALMKALGGFGDDTFTQLDRASRKLQSADMATGFVRLCVAQTYLDAFAETAVEMGATTAILIHQGEEDRVIKLSDIQMLRELFHPNTTHELRVRL